jgi:hypothetical protein
MVAPQRCRCRSIPASAGHARRAGGRRRPGRALPASAGKPRPPPTVARWPGPSRERGGAFRGVPLARK